MEDLEDLMVVVLVNIPEFKKELEEYLNKKMFIFGQLLANEIQDKIEEIPLWGKGKFWGGIHSFVDPEGNIIIESTVFYDIFLEYGTYDYWDQYGVDSFTEPMHPKKKDMALDLKKAYPTGMQPFAPFRRILWNEKIMEEKLSEAFESSV